MVITLKGINSMKENLTPSEKVGLRLKSIRIETSLTADDVARAINVNRDCITKLEQGQHDQPLYLVGRLSKLYGVPIDYIVSVIDQRNARREI